MKKIEDERILSEKRKINSTAFGLGFLGLWGILLFRIFILKQSVPEYLDIFLLTLGLSIYITINNVLSGLYLTYRSKHQRKRVNIIGALVGSLTFFIVQFIMMKADLTKIEDLLKLLVSLIIFFIVWVLMQNYLFKVSEHKANKDL